MTTELPPSENTRRPGNWREHRFTAAWDEPDAKVIIPVPYEPERNIAAKVDAAVGNVVIIHVDDLGWRDLGCMGSPVYETPHIDALAESGTRYTSAYAAGSLCTPSRACMLALTSSTMVRSGKSRFRR